MSTTILEDQRKKRRHYRVCAYCGKREYGENIAKLMKLTPYGSNDRSESRFAHKECPKK